MIACLLCAVGAGQGSRNEQDHGGGRAASVSHSDSWSYFFGTSQEQNAKHCPSAWLIYLDKEHHIGEIFVVAGMERFSKFDLGEDETLTFQWKKLGDTNYRFSGTLKSDELAGDIQLINARSGNTKYLCEITAAQFPPQNAQANPEHNVLPGRFSNETYVNESGDLIGVDIRFFSTSQGMKGMIVFYEGYWDEPTFTPLALSQIEINKGVIHFTAEMPSGVAHYHLRPTPTGAFFTRDDVPHEMDDKEIRLRKYRDVLPAVVYY
jgi:hypothetical protein